MRKWIPVLIIAAAVIASAAVYSQLPERMPAHWNSAGEVDEWSGKTRGAWLGPFVLIGLWVMLRFLPRIDPKRANYAKFGGTYEAVIVTIMLFALAVHAVGLRAGLGMRDPVNHLAPLGIAALMIVIGNLLPRARPNWFLGIRTPWTLSSDRVWEKTHRLGGRLLVLGGIVVALTALFATPMVHPLMIGTLVISSLTTVVYSYLEWRRLQGSDAARQT